MKRSLDSWKDIDKQAEFKKESDRLIVLFANADENSKALASGLIENAAYLYAENKVLRAMLSKTGMVQINPNNSSQQRPVEAAKQYRANCDTYSSIVGRLSKLLGSQIDEGDDDMEEFE